MVSALIFSILTIYGGVVSRIHGGGIIELQKVWANLLWALPFAMTTLLIYNVYFSLTGSIFSAIITLLVTMAFKGTGHGQYFTLGHGGARGGSLVSDYDADDKPEALDPIVEAIYGPETKENKPTRDLIGLTIVGAAATLPCALYLLPVNGLAAILVTLGGALKSVAYYIGWKLFDPAKFPSPTNVGEVLTGIFAMGGLALALCLYLN